MQKKSESWCTWLVSRMKSLICLREHKQTSKHLDMKHLGKLLDIGPLEALPDNQFNSVMKYLDAKSLLALKYSNKAIKNKIDKLNKDTKEYNTKEMLLKENYEKNLLRCAYIVFMCACDSGGTGDFAKQLVDYKTGEKFKHYDANVLRQTLYDFAERFIKPKDNIKFNCFIKELDLWQSWDYSGASEKFVKDMFAAAGFTENEIWDKADMKDVAGKFWNELNQRRRLGDSYNESIEKTKKQIQNYEQITGKLYKSIYGRIKNTHNTEKPGRESYIKAYEELNK